MARPVCMPTTKGRYRSNHSVRALYTRFGKREEQTKPFGCFWPVTTVTGYSSIQVGLRRAVSDDEPTDHLPGRAVVRHAPKSLRPEGLLIAQQLVHKFRLGID